MSATQSTAPPNAKQTFEDIAAQYEKTVGIITRPVAAYLAALAQNHGLGSSGDANILDNACGTGIVLDEILTRYDSGFMKELRLTAIDAAPMMITIAKEKMRRDWMKQGQGVQEDRFRAVPLAAEEMDILRSDYFTHSFTNFGFQFFKDPQKAAGDVYRTLKPGGYAYVSAWAYIGYIQALNAASDEIRPGKPHLKLPWGDEWYEASHLKGVMAKAGFESIEMLTCDSAWSGESMLDIAKSMGIFFVQLAPTQGWTMEEATRIPEAMAKAFEAYSKEAMFQKDGLWNMKMVANIAVCKK